MIKVVTFGFKCSTYALHHTSFGHKIFGSRQLLFSGILPSMPQYLQITKSPHPPQSPNPQSLIVPIDQEKRKKWNWGCTQKVNILLIFFACLFVDCMYGSVKIILEENNHVISNKPVNKTAQFTPEMWLDILPLGPCEPRHECSAVLLQFWIKYIYTGSVNQKRRKQLY